MTARTGQQYEITFSDYSAIITEFGAALRKFTYKNEDVIVSLGQNDPIYCCEGQILVPFPGRIQNATYTFENVTYTLPMDEHDRKTALHGFGNKSYWHLVEHNPQSVTLSWRMPFLNGYPFDISVQATYLLSDDGLHIQVSATNNDSVNAPYAVAIHPWLANGLHGKGDEIDEHNAQCRLTIPANTHVIVDDMLIPTGETCSVENTKYDLRNHPLLVDQPFDDAWIDLEYDASGNTTATFTRPDGMEVEVGGDNSIKSFQVCSATGFPEHAHPAGVAVEPMTAYGNAFNSGKYLTVLHPQETTCTNFFIRVVKDKN
ncbi:MAG: aldose 1-epimerase family protein [Bifidobacteriaceae bacterium]|nr:aldose 1-epimerase family protein [Bifidobacteriaceae bacterium]